MLHQSEQYYDRMDSSIQDKISLIQGLTPGAKILDVGCGDGVLTAALLGLGFDAYGIDAAPASILAASVRHPELEGRIFEGYAHQGSAIFGTEKFDAVICSSLVHEIYSYGTPELGALSMEAVKNSLDDFNLVLKRGGSLLIRDGIAVTDWTQKVRATFRPGFEEDAAKFIEKYSELAPFVTSPDAPEEYRKVALKLSDNRKYVEGNAQSIMELLYTYTWGWQDIEREAKELYGVFNFHEWRDIVFKAGFRVTQAYSYLQPGYPEHLVDKVFLTSDGKSVPWFSSNMKLVATAV